MQPENTTFITAYGPKVVVGLNCPQSENKTQQSFKDDSDINNIMARFQATGLLDYVNEHEARYADVTGFDFQQSMQIIATANELFEALPANIRKRFQNNPEEFLDFVQNPENQEEAVKLGIATAKPKEATPVADPKPATTGDPIAALEKVVPGKTG